MAAVLSLAALISVSVEGDAAGRRQLPSFKMLDLSEVEHSLGDEEFKDKVILVAGFGTWQEVSRDQAHALTVFHKAHPEVAIVAFVVADVASARDFIHDEGLEYGCYKADRSPHLDRDFDRLFETKTGMTIRLNRIPFVFLADKSRNVTFANIGLTTAATLSKELAKIKD